MSKKAKFECYLHWEGIKRGETTAGSYDVYLGVYKTEETDNELEDDCITPELDEDASEDALCYLDEYADKVTSCVVKLTRVKTSGKGPKKVIERKNSFELDISNFVDNFVGEVKQNEDSEKTPSWLTPNEKWLLKIITGPEIKTICLTEIKGIKEVHFLAEFFEKHPEALTAKTRGELFNIDKDWCRYTHRTDGPAIILDDEKIKGKFYMIYGLPIVQIDIFPEFDIEHHPDAFKGSEYLINLIEERGRSKKSIVD